MSACQDRQIGALLLIYVAPSESPSIHAHRIYIMSDTTSMSTAKETEELAQKSTEKKQENVLEVTPIVPDTLIVVYRPSDGRPVTFSRDSLARFNNNRLDSHVSDEIPYSFQRC